MRSDGRDTPEDRKLCEDRAVQIRTEFPHRVTRTDHLWLEAPDGCRLAARLWRPETADPVPVILEAVPYRKGDGTAAGDQSQNAYLAGHGFACLRLDLRGSGDSDGLLDDEYTVQEQDDVEFVIGWLAAQPWCNGSVGMTGVSWGGFACVQAAARTPPALKAIAPLHFTDDRYADDVHYRGGCVLGLDMLQWAVAMEAYRAQPPDPDLVGEEWRARWRERLDGHEPFILPWLSHQRRDAYWRVGSACEHHERITCDVFAIGGWADGYRDAVLRMLEHAPGRSRGLIGPWGHTSPESGKPGPEIGFLQELVRFFGASLRGDDNGFWDEPQLIAFIQAATPPATSCATRAGHWVAEASWPSPEVRMEALDLPEGPPRALRGLQLCGLDAGVWCGDGGPADLPGDQRADDGASLCWDWPVETPVELLGHVVAELELEADRPAALAAVRLCDVAPDGASALIAREVFNLTHREGHDRVVAVVPGERMRVRIPLMSTGYALPAGHVLRLAVSPTYWPWAWPSPEAVTLTVHGGRVELPVRTGEGAPPLPQWGPAEAAAPLESESLHAGRTGRTLTRDLATAATELAFDWIDHRTRHKASGTVLGERNMARYRIAEGDPLSAEVECATTVELERADWAIRTEITARMTCTREAFIVTTTLDAYDGTRRSHARRWTHEIPRDGG
jgi:predicted acyl esterase